MFDRWDSYETTSWPYRVLVHHYNEINRLIMSHKSANRLVYSTLKGLGATDSSKAADYIYTSNGNQKLTIKDWSGTYNDFDNWTRLNALMALTSVFETYIESVIWLALESDPATIINASRSIDGLKLLKDGKPFNRKLLEEKIEACTHGDWNSRVAHIKTIFRSIPQVFEDEISDLDKLRTLRNNVGHAFGRDIKESRNYDYVRIEPMARISVDRFRKFQSLIRRTARQLDAQLLSNHIGNFQPLYYYHAHVNDMHRYPIISERIVYLKANLGKWADHVYSKDFCAWVIMFYERI